MAWIKTIGALIIITIIALVLWSLHPDPDAYSTIKFIDHVTLSVALMALVRTFYEPE